jgi:Uma2 family endonuclease
MEYQVIMATLKTRIGPADQGRKMTLDEFREAEEEPRYRYELARGVLEVIEIPKTPDRRVVSRLFSLAALYKNEHPNVIDYFGGGAEVRIWKPGMDTARHPDLGIVFLNAPLDEVGDLQPYLVAEVVSPSSKTRDYQEKREDYLAYGVREYWIVDPLQRQVTILSRRELGDGADWAERVLRDGDLLESPLLPGLATPVAELWMDL